MGFEFTIAVQPELTHIDKELRYIKSALLYADKITLISPMAYIYTQLTLRDENFDEKKIIKILKMALPLIEKRDPKTYAEGLTVVNQLSSIMYNKKYKGIPVLQKLELRTQIRELLQEVDTPFLEMMGESQTEELNKLLKSGKLVLQKFEHSLADVDGCVSDYFELLTKSVKNSMPLFDEPCNKLMKSAMTSRIITFSESEKQKITHAGISDNLISRLPDFNEASVDEIIDIRKALDRAVVRFRSKIISYSENIQSLPWDDDFEYECSRLYYKEIAPAVLEIDELTKENGFVKNLLGNTFSDRSFLKSAGGLVVGVAAAGVIPSFTQAVSADTAMLVAGGAWAAEKIVAAYKEYQKKEEGYSKKRFIFLLQSWENVRWCRQ
jgi:hypothetical protein